jgi:hypothetical protein
VAPTTNINLLLIRKLGTCLVVRTEYPASQHVWSDLKCSKKNSGGRQQQPLAIRLLMSSPTLPLFRSHVLT